MAEGLWRQDDEIALSKPAPVDNAAVMYLRKASRQSTSRSGVRQTTARRNYWNHRLQFSVVLAGTGPKRL